MHPYQTPFPHFPTSLLQTPLPRCNNVKLLPVQRKAIPEERRVTNMAVDFFKYDSMICKTSRFVDISQTAFGIP